MGQRTLVMMPFRVGRFAAQESCLLLTSPFIEPGLLTTNPCRVPRKSSVTGIAKSRLRSKIPGRQLGEQQIEAMKPPRPTAHNLRGGGCFVSRYVGSRWKCDGCAAQETMGPAPFLTSPHLFGYHKRNGYSPHQISYEENSAALPGRCTITKFLRFCPGYCPASSAEGRAGGADCF